MANWTVSQSSTTTTQGATVSANVVLTITPNVGFVISASDFKIGEATETSTNVWSGGNVDIGVNTVTFADVTTAGAVGNTVTATVAFDSFSMPSSDKEFFIDIDEKPDKTVENVDRYFCIRTQHVAETNGQGTNKHVVTYASAPTGITTTNNAVSIHNIGDGLVEHLHQGTVPQGVAAPGTLIFSIDFDANETWGYYYSSEPTIGILSGGYSSYYTFVNSGHLYDDGTTTSTSTNKLVFVTVKGYYTPPVGVVGLDPDPASSSSSMCELGQSILISHVIRQNVPEQPGSTRQIINVVIDQSNIDPSGEIRNIHIMGDYLAQGIFEVVSSDASKTYDFGTTGSGVNGTFTASATNSYPITWGSVGNPSWPIYFPPISSDTYYDIIVTPTSPTTAATGVPIAANDMRIHQYATVTVSLGLNDGANKYEDAALLSGDPNPAGGTGIQGNAGSITNVTKPFSYTITESMVTDSGNNTLSVKTEKDYTLNNTGIVTSDLNGDAGGTSFDVDSTTGISAGNSINWSIRKDPLFTLDETSVITVASYNPDAPTEGTPNVDNIVVGMIVTGFSTLISKDVTVQTVQEGVISLSESIDVEAGTPLTFTADGVTVSSVTDENTLVASQTMAGVKDNFELSFGGGAVDTIADVSDMSVTKVGNNVIIAGNFNVQSFPTSDSIVKLDLNELITLPS